MGDLGGLLQNFKVSKDPNRHAYAASSLNNLYGNLTISGNNLWTTAATTYTTWPQNPAPLMLTPAPSRERTNLDWLDERVNEMRVRL